MEPSHPLSLCVFLFLLSILGYYSVAVECITYSDCAPFPFKCGSIINITYPFLADGRHAVCGHPSFYLTCENDSPVISVSSMPFVVRDINYNTRALTLVSKDIVDANCPIPYKSHILDTSTFIFATEDQYVNVYSKCSVNVTDPDFHEIPCLRDIDEEGRGGYYVLPSSRDPTSWFGKYCNGSTIDILDAGLKRLEQKNSSSTFGDVVNEGFRLTWDAGDRWCNDVSSPVADAATAMNRVEQYSNTGGFHAYMWLHCPNSQFSLSFNAFLGSGHTLQFRIKEEVFVI
ncbi:hypothetical protein H6P81_010475 [Aristolochia fimbriata]|uniref:Wall-associated receptor kinase galacturonan-binding domain-containing protein n=1 Tax=Aristolochia fimbriata TaxID=158543 RepID=A0AAV7ENV2_ARIFI|nr:hypothetical protein H6P81_010475 [Aristolochia fimbriata]